VPHKYVPRTDSKMTPEQRARISAAVKKRFEDPEERVKNAERLRAINGTPEKRAEAARKANAYHERTRRALALLAEAEAEADRG
jgi:hypothetical protein